MSFSRHSADHNDLRMSAPKNFPQELKLEHDELHYSIKWPFCRLAKNWKDRGRAKMVRVGNMQSVQESLLAL